MAKKEEVSKAELYRQERKERLAKESKKNAKRNAAIAKAKRIALKTVAIVAAVAIVMGIAVGVVNASGSQFFKASVAKVGNEKISTTEFMYYYRRTHMNMYSNAQSVDSSYGAGTYANYYGFDYTLSPDEQEYKNEEGAEKTYKTWDDYITDNIITMLQSNIILADEAEKAGIKLDESEKKEVADQLTEIESSAKSNSMTVNAYLRNVFGKGVNKNNFEKWLLRDSLANKYSEIKKNELFDSYSADDINAEFKKNSKDYAYTDIRLYSFNVETPELAEDATEKEKTDATAKAAKEAKKEAQKFIDKINSSKAFVTAAKALDKANASNSTSEAAATDEDTTLVEKFAYATVKDNFTEDEANWLFDASRKAGDKTVLEYKQEGTVSGYYAVYIIKPMYKDTEFGADAKGYLFSYDTDADDTSKAATEKKAQAVVDAWNALTADKKTGEKFTSLVSELYPDQASSIPCTDYDNYEKGTLDEAVSTWILNDKRKDNDAKVIATTNGCYVMLYMNKNTEENWKIHIRETLSTSDYDTYYKNLEKSDDYAIKDSGALLDFAEKNTKKRVIKDIKYYIYQMQQNSSAASGTATAS